MQENVSHHFGCCYNWALGFVESACVVFDVAHLPHQRRDPSAGENSVKHPSARTQGSESREWGVSGSPPVEAVLQPFADGAEVGGVCHRSAVQRVVLQVHW